MGNKLKEGLTPNQWKVIPRLHLFPLTQHAYPDGCGLFQDDAAPTHRLQGITE